MDLAIIYELRANNISEEQIRYLKGKLSHEEKEKILEEGKTTAAWIYQILKKIGES